MANRKKAILLAEDMSPESSGAKRSAANRKIAAELARRLDTSVALVHVEDFQLFPNPEPDYRSVLERYFSEEKARFRKTVAGMGVPVEPHFVMGEPVRELLKFANRPARFELAVVGTRGRKWLSRLFLGSVAEEVTRHAKIPVLTVGPAAQGAAFAFKHLSKPLLVVGTDLSTNSRRAEEFAASLAKRLGGRLLLVHSLHEALHPVLETAFSAPSHRDRLAGMLDALKKDAFRKLQARARRLRTASVETEVLLSDRPIAASKLLISIAKGKNAALLVTGTHGRSTVTAAFFGRTARDVILGATVPVITVRSRG